MAGDWIKFEVSTLDKPEVCQIADLAGIDPDAAIGKLLRVWAWFDQQTEKGNAPSVSKKLLDRLVGVTGFCEFMQRVHWMDDDGESISLPHFDRHNGKTAKNRALTAKRVAGFKEKGNAKGNAAIVTDALPREEKRREDIYKPPLSPSGGKKNDKFDLSAVVYPLAFNRPKWDEWLENRKANGKRVTLIAARKQIAFLADYSPEQQSSIIDQSIMNGYTGLFPPKGGSNGQAGQSGGFAPRPDNSAVGQVRAGIARENAARAATTGGDPMGMANDDLHVRPQMGEQLRSGSGPGSSMGIVLEGDFQRSD